MKHNRILSNTQKQDTKATQHVTLTQYNDKTHKIAQTFRKLKYKIAQKTNTTIRKHLNQIYTRLTTITT